MSASSSHCSNFPTAAFIPTGKPVASAISSIKVISSGTLLNALWFGGDNTSLPISTPLIVAISFVIFAPGKTPPFPGFAPCESLISIALTKGLSSTSLTIFFIEKPPSAALTPKYPVPK